MPQMLVADYAVSTPPINHDDLADNFRNIPSNGNPKLTKDERIFEDILAKREVDQGKIQVQDFLSRVGGTITLLGTKGVTQALCR